MTAAVKAANPNDPEGIAWCRVQIGNELMHAGRLAEAEREFDQAARKSFEKFETLERENARIERSWRYLVNYWLDHDRNLEQALTLATQEYEARKDIFTCDSLAWALFKNGRPEEAKKLIKEALRTGTKDARITQHAQIIYKT